MQKMLGPFQQIWKTLKIPGKPELFTGRQFSKADVGNYWIFMPI